MRVEQLLDDLQEELAAVWGSGLALPGPDRPLALQALAVDLDRCGLEWAAGRVRDLAQHLGAPDAEVPAARQTRIASAYAELQLVAAWVRTFRAGWGLAVAQRRLEETDGADGAEATSRRPAGITADVRPVGVERAGSRWTIHAFDSARRWVALTDEVAEVDAWDPIGEPVTSRLFQDEIVLSDVLGATLRLTDHPFVSSGERTVVGPAYSARPMCHAAGDGPAPIHVSTLSVGHPVRVTLELQATPQGWQLCLAGEELPVEIDDTLAFNLDKWAALGRTDLEAVVLPRGKGASMLAMMDTLGNPCFPHVDPGAVLWPLAGLVQRADLPRDDGLALASLGVQAPAVHLGSDPSPAARVLHWWCTGQVEPLPVPMAGEGPLAGYLAVWSHVVRDLPIPEDLEGRFTRSMLPGRPSLEEVAARGLCTGGAPGRALLEAHCSALRRGIRQAEVLPPALSLWAFADALTRMRPEADRLRFPLRALALPPGLVRRSAAEGLTAWLQGTPADEEVLEAVLMVALSGDVGSWAPL